MVERTHSAHAQFDLPAIRHITPADLRIALVRGIDDFRAKPSHYVFLGLIYPIAMLVAVRVVLGEGLLPLVFPIVSGGALLGPFVALGLYEMSRRREQGLDMSWRHALGVVRARSRGAIAALGIVLAAMFAAWLWVAMAIYDMTLGVAAPSTAGAFAELLFTTQAGWTLIIVGNTIGALFAIAAFAISVVSFPLLLDRETGAVNAMMTSINAVITSPGTMLLWGLIVVAMLAVAAIPAFVGLALAIPVLGHATWHLYRRTVEG